MNFQTAATEGMTMWGFTRVQQRAILFLLATFGAGCVVLLYRRQQPAPAVAPALAAQVQSFSRQAGRDSVPGDSVSPAFALISSKQEKIAFARININTASAAELTALPGIGATMAQRIVSHREQYGKFRRLEDLAGVKGIGKRKLEALKEWVAVE